MKMKAEKSYNNRKQPENMNLSKSHLQEGKMKDQENFLDEMPSTSSPVSTQTIFPSENDQYITYLPKKKPKIYPVQGDLQDSIRNDSGYDESDQTPGSVRKKYHGKINDINKKVMPKTFKKPSPTGRRTGVTQKADSNINRHVLKSPSASVRHEDIDDVSDDTQTNDAHRPLVQSDNSCHLIIGYKSIDGTPDLSLMNSWLKWSGTWDAYTMMQEEMLQVESMTMYVQLYKMSIVNV